MVVVVPVGLVRIVLALVPVDRDASCGLVAKLVADGRSSGRSLHDDKHAILLRIRSRVRAAGGVHVLEPLRGFRIDHAYEPSDGRIEVLVALIVPRLIAAT